jgi:hypothetical protein
MGKQTLRCSVCKHAKLGTCEDPRFVDGTDHFNHVLMCEACGALYNKFRIAAVSEDVKAAALARDLLTLRGATVLALHLKLLEDHPEEARKLARFGADFNEVIKSQATPDELLMLGVKR